MNRFGILVMAALLSAVICYGQTLSVPSQAAPPAIGHGAFPVKVTKTIESSKLKEGDIIELETVGSFKLPDGTLVPKGSKLVGRVVDSKARSKGDLDSHLTLSFEKLNISKERQLAVKGVVQAVYPPADEEMGPNMATAGTSQGGSMGGSKGGFTSPGGGVGVTNAQSGSDPQSHSRPQAVMDLSATGVQGVRDLQLQNGVLVSSGKAVKLHDGVRLIVRAEIFRP
jgi:hypothetical protein